MKSVSTVIIWYAAYALAIAAAVGSSILVFRWTNNEVLGVVPIVLIPFYILATVKLAFIWQRE